MISTQDDWTGAINSGWAQSAQTLSFTNDVTLNTFGRWLGQESTHTVSIVEWNNEPGASRYTNTSLWTAGDNELTLNLALNAGTQYAAWFDYMGNTTDTVHFNSAKTYAGGEWWLLSGTTWSSWFSGNDMRFRLTYTEGHNNGNGNAVPEPGSLALLGLGLAALGLARRKKIV